jgi:hypothetical protein
MWGEVVWISTLHIPVKLLCFTHAAMTFPVFSFTFKRTYERWGLKEKESSG